MDFQSINLTNLTNNPIQHQSPSNHVSNSSIFASDALIGALIWSNKGEVLGSIKEMMMNVISGKLCYAVLSAKLDEKLFAIPWDAVLYDKSQKIFFINMSADKVALAPSFDNSNWPNMANEMWADKIHAFFGIPMKRSNSLHSAM